VRTVSPGVSQGAGTRISAFLQASGNVNPSVCIDDHPFQVRVTFATPPVLAAI